MNLNPIRKLLLLMKANNLKVIKYRVLKICLAALLVLFQTTLRAQEEGYDSRYISLKSGEVSLVYMPGIKRVAIGNPDIVSYKTIDDSQVMLIGIGPGKTNVYVWGEGDRQIRYWISVDQRHLNRDIEVARSLLRDLDRVRVYELEEKIIIEGEVYKEDAVQIKAVQQLLPNAVFSVSERKVTRGQTVRIDAVLVEISNGDLKKIGVDWDDSLTGPTFAFHKEFYSNGRFGVYEDDPDGVHEGIISTVDVGDRSFFSYFGITSHIMSRINLLNETGRASILTAPKLTTVDGQLARFKVGGSYPIPFIDSNGALTVEKQDYGVILDVTPTIDREIINVKLKVELSDIDNSVQINGVPGLKSRTTETVVQLKNNQTIAISGLFQADESSSENKVPFLGDIPYIRKLFGAESTDFKDRQVVVLITPKLISASDADDRAMSGFGRDVMKKHSTHLTVDQSLIE